MARTEAARRGFGGPWDDASVRAFLEGAGRRGGGEVRAGGFDALSVARELAGTGIERGQADAISKAVRSAAGARDEDLVKRADLESAVAVVRADRCRALWLQGVGIVAVVAALRFLPV